MRFLPIFLRTRHYFWLKLHIWIGFNITYNFSFVTMVGKTHLHPFFGLFYKQFFKKWGFWPFSQESVIGFGGMIIIRKFSTLSTTFLLAPSSGKLIFTLLSAILGIFLTKVYDFQIVIHWDRGIFKVQSLHQDKVFLVFLKFNLDPFY